MRLFKKKKKVEEKKKLDFSGYDLKLNIKSICYFEQLTDKSFFEFDNSEDVLHLIYAMLVINNECFLTFDAFKILVQDERIMSWVMEKTSEIIRKSQEIKPKGDVNDKDRPKQKVGEIAAVLITKYKIDIHYVMYDMELWEMNYYLEAADKVVKEEYETNRLWTYFNIIPHVDSKKLKGPEDLIRFPWEENRKEKQLEENSAAAVSFLMNNAKKEVENGEGGPDNSTEREGVSGGTTEIGTT